MVRRGLPRSVLSLQRARHIRRALRRSTTRTARRPPVNACPTLHTHIPTHAHTHSLSAHPTPREQLLGVLDVLSKRLDSVATCAEEVPLRMTLKPQHPLNGQVQNQLGVYMDADIRDEEQALVQALGPAAQQRDREFVKDVRRCSLSCTHTHTHTAHIRMTQAPCTLRLSLCMAANDSRT